ncbi:MAG: hypothetical protein EPN33_08310 [Acidobacteria bacterium]|nr:MAG: hypothetical protein EPN33_08310 [Acidobacteriota bacterium]
MLSRDTSPEMEQRQIERWRQMTAAEKLRLVGMLRASVLQLAGTGVRMRFPEAGEREVFLRVAELALGPALARKAYPEIDWPA